MKILAFGGSFDPPHAGHVALLSAAARAVDPDLILVVPAWRNPLKARTAAGAADRLEMVRLGVLDSVPGQWRRRTWIYMGELSSGGPVYTVDTLAVLAREFPAAELHFAVGWDAAAQFSSWRQPARLKSLARWWTARRPGASGDAPSLFRRLSAPMPAISSTELRARLSIGEETGNSVAPGVLAYIEKRGLYGLDRLAALRGMLSAERFEHSRSVARLCGALARRWSLDEETALLAGLLHDCGRSVPVARMAAYVRRHGVKVPEREETARRRPLLLHAYISGDLCRRRFGVNDPAILSAVGKHTLGSAAMAALDRLVYVADACSEDRAYPEAAQLRRLAFDDLDEAYAACLRHKLDHCLREGSWVHPETIKAWNALAS
jgi:nicotinate (nicotinamide) nucleotide adenylyltransferase